jgi:hypothetical protein
MSPLKDRAESSHSLPRPGGGRRRHRPLDTRVATLAWLGAVNEIAIQSFPPAAPRLADTIFPLTELLLRSVGVTCPRSRPRSTRPSRFYSEAAMTLRQSPARMARKMASLSSRASTSIQARPKWGGRWASSVAIFTSGISSVS